MGGVAEVNRGANHVSQLGQVKYLHAVVVGFTDHKGVVGIHFDIAPRGVGGMGGQMSQVNWVFRVADVDKRSAVGASHNGVFVAILGVSPTPNIVAIAAAAHTAEGQEGHEIDVVTGITSG